MKVCLIFREKRPGGFSIEEVFRCVRQVLQNRVEFVSFEVDPSRSMLWNIRAVGRIRADVYHITGDCNYLALGLPGNKTILTVHDIGHYERTLRGWKKWLYGWLWWRLPLRRVGTITAVSSFTRERLQAVFGIPPQKVKVVYNPVFSFVQPASKPFNKAKPRILQIGSGSNKNLEGLMEAVKDIPCHLVLVNRLSAAQEEWLQQHGISYEIHTAISPEQMGTLYRSADILFFASTYEGFGLPIIEAFGTGIPVITSTVASMPEIAGDAALLVDPFRTAAIREAILRIISDDALREQLVRRGFERAKDFEPEKIASDYLKLY